MAQIEVTLVVRYPINPADYNPGGPAPTDAECMRIDRGEVEKNQMSYADLIEIADSVSTSWKVIPDAN